MSLKYEALGRGPSNVLVIHDWSQDTTSNDFIKPYLNQDAFTFVFADLRGYGKSEDLTGNYTLAEAVADITDLADALGWAKFSLVSHSMTGMVAQKAMIDIPHRLNRVVLTAPVPACGLNVDDETLAFFLSMVTHDEPFKQGMHGLTTALYGDAWASYKLARNRATVNADAMKAYCHMWAKTNFSDEMKDLSTPVFVICGRYDSESLRLDALEPMFAHWFPNLKTYVCESGHYPMQETPVKYAHVLQEYLLS
jgi:3-oxoadipate enol-lactonase